MNKLKLTDPGLEKQFGALFRECERLHAILEHGEVGLAMWHMMVADRIRGVRDEARNLLEGKAAPTHACTSRG